MLKSISSASSDIAFVNYVMFDMLRRPRRNRKSPVIREMIRENAVSVSDLIYPLFLIGGKNKKKEVASMPGIFRLSPDLLLKEIEACMKLGIMAFDVFPALNDKLKDRVASEALNKKGLYLSTLKQIKKRFPEIALMTDVAMDPYSSDGHDGLVENGEIVNDKTLGILGKMALAQAEAGADIIGPSDMMDGRVGHIRKTLDKNGFTDVSIMSYTAKYASAFYGPFRDALSSAPKQGDKKTYQMDPANVREALLEARLDEEEGADFLMVKPALSYLDVICCLKDNSQLPIAAYNVSGEYSMIKAASAKGWIDGGRVRDEVLLSIKRAGASVILTYFAKEFAESKN
jgi:porphobilinogen synthase